MGPTAVTRSFRRNIFRQIFTCALRSREPYRDGRGKSHRKSLPGLLVFLTHGDHNDLGPQGAWQCALTGPGPDPSRWRPRRRCCYTWIAVSFSLDSGRSVQGTGSSPVTQAEFLEEISEGGFVPVATGLRCRATKGEIRLLPCGGAAVARLGRPAHAGPHTTDPYRLRKTRRAPGAWSSEATPMNFSKSPFGAWGQHGPSCEGQERGPRVPA